MNMYSSRTLLVEIMLELSFRLLLHNNFFSRTKILNRLQRFQNRFDIIVCLEIEAPSLHAILGVYVFLHLCYSKGKFDDILSIPSFP